MLRIKGKLHRYYVYWNTRNLLIVLLSFSGVKPYESAVDKAFATEMLSDKRPISNAVDRILETAQPNSQKHLLEMDGFERVSLQSNTKPDMRLLSKT